MKHTLRQQKILEIIKNQPDISISEIKKILQIDITQVTLNRDLAVLVKSKSIQKIGKGRATRYLISSSFQLFSPINLDTYFEKEIDIRDGNNNLIRKFLQY